MTKPPKLPKCPYCARDMRLISWSDGWQVHCDNGRATIGDIHGQFYRRTRAAAIKAASRRVK